jgi:hypothetical protein
MGKKKGGLFGGEFGQGFFIINFVFSSPYCEIARPPAPPPHTKTHFSQSFLFGNFVLLSKWRSSTGRFSQIWLKDKY